MSIKSSKIQNDDTQIMLGDRNKDWNHKSAPHSKFIIKSSICWLNKCEQIFSYGWS